MGMYNEDMRNRELNNGRFAMFAAIGIIAAEMFTGKDGVEQIYAALNLGSSPPIDVLTPKLSYAVTLLTTVPSTGSRGRLLPLVLLPPVLLVHDAAPSARRLRFSAQLSQK